MQSEYFNSDGTMTYVHVCSSSGYYAPTAMFPQGTYVEAGATFLPPILKESENA